MGSDPVQGVLDRQPTLPPGIDRILSAGRIRSSGGPIQSRIRQTRNTLRSPLPRSLQWPVSKSNRSDPDATHQPQTGNARPADPGTSGHPNQLRRRRMSQTKPGRHPLRKIPSPIRQEPLTPISIDQPVTDLGIENGQTREQMRQDPIGLIIGEALPLHAPNVRNRCDRNGQKNRPMRKKLSETSRARLNSRRRAPAAPLDPGWPTHTRHAAIPGLDRWRPRPGWSHSFGIRPSRHGPLLRLG